MNKQDFLTSLKSMTIKEINDYIEEKGKESKKVYPVNRVKNKNDN